MKSITLCLVIWALLLTPIVSLSQIPAIPAKPAEKSPVTVNQTFTALEPTRKSRFLSSAWSSGTLPEPMRPVTVQFEDKEGAIYAMLAQQGKAEAYAKAIAAGDQNSMSAVVGAMMQAGFIIQNNDGTKQQWSGAQGMPVPAYQIAAMAKQYGQGQSVSLKSFVHGFERTFKPLRDKGFQGLLLSGIREGASGKVPEIMFWSQMIAELGKHSDAPYDILDEGIDVNRIRFDPIQREMILMRLAGDLMVLQQNRTATTGRVNDTNFQKVSYTPVKMIRTPSSATIADTPQCNLSSEDGVVVDMGALAASRVFSQLASVIDSMARMAGTGNFGRYIRFTGFANILLNLLKFVATYAAIQIDLSMDGTAATATPTLTRTKTRAPGERKKITAHVHIETGRWAGLATCVRPLLNLLGFDFSLPGNGAMSNVKVTFVLEEDESGPDRVEAIFHNANVGNYFGDSNTDYSLPVGGVRLMPANTPDAGAHSAAVIKPSFTDGNGMASINIIGESQDQDLSNRKLTGLQRRIGIMAFIQAKTTDPADLESDPSQWTGLLGDYLGPLVSFVTGDSLGAAIGAATETLYRSSWYSSDVFPFIVKDWKSCGECWQGTVTMTSNINVNTNETLNGLTMLRNYSKTTEVTVTIMIDQNGTMTSTAKVVDTAKGSGEDNGVDRCHADIRGGVTTQPWSSTKRTTDTANGSANSYPSISVDGNHVQILIDTDPIARVISVEDKSSGGCDPGHSEGSRTSTFNDKNKYTININADGVPSRPNTAHGTQTITNPNGSTTYKWDLTRQ